MMTVRDLLVQLLELPPDLALEVWTRDGEPLGGLVRVQQIAGSPMVREPCLRLYVEAEDLHCDCRLRR